MSDGKEKLERTVLPNGAVSMGRPPKLVPVAGTAKENPFSKKKSKKDGHGTQLAAEAISVESPKGMLPSDMFAARAWSRSTKQQRELRQTYREILDRRTRDSHQDKVSQALTNLFNEVRNDTPDRGEASVSEHNGGTYEQPEKPRIPELKEGEVARLQRTLRELDRINEEVEGLLRSQEESEVLVDQLGNNVLTDKSAQDRVKRSVDTAIMKMSVKVEERKDHLSGLGRWFHAKSAGDWIGGSTDMSIVEVNDSVESVVEAATEASKRLTQHYVETLNFCQGMLERTSGANGGDDEEDVGDLRYGLQISTHAVAALTKKLDEVAARLSEIETENGALKREIEERRERYEGVIQEKDAEIVHLNFEHERLEGDLANLLQHMQTQTAQWSEKIATQETTAKELETLKEYLKSLEYEKSNHARTTVRLQKETSSLKEQLVLAEGRLLEAAREKKKLQKDLDVTAFQGMSVTATQEINSLKEQLAQVNNMCNLLEDEYQQEIRDLENRMEDEAAEYAEQIAELEQQVDELQESLAAAYDSNATLHRTNVAVLRDATQWEQERNVITERLKKMEKGSFEHVPKLTRSKTTKSVTRGSDGLGKGLLFSESMSDDSVDGQLEVQERRRGRVSRGKSKIKKSKSKSKFKPKVEPKEGANEDSKGARMDEDDGEVEEEGGEASSSSINAILKESAASLKKELFADSGGRKKEHVKELRRAHFQLRNVVDKHRAFKKEALGTRQRLERSLQDANRLIDDMQSRLSLQEKQREKMSARLKEVQQRNQELKAHGAVAKVPKAMPPQSRDPRKKRRTSITENMLDSSFVLRTDKSSPDAKPRKLSMSSDGGSSRRRRPSFVSVDDEKVSLADFAAAHGVVEEYHRDEETVADDAKEALLQKVAGVMERRKSIQVDAGTAISALHVQSTSLAPVAELGEKSSEDEDAFATPASDAALEQKKANIEAAARKQVQEIDEKELAPLLIHVRAALRSTNARPRDIATQTDQPVWDTKRDTGGPGDYTSKIATAHVKATRRMTQTSLDSREKPSSEYVPVKKVLHQEDPPSGVSGSRVNLKRRPSSEPVQDLKSDQPRENGALAVNEKHWNSWSVNADDRVQLHNSDEEEMLTNKLVPERTCLACGVPRGMDDYSAAMWHTESRRVCLHCMYRSGIETTFSGRPLSTSRTKTFSSAMNALGSPTRVEHQPDVNELPSLEPLRPGSRYATPMHPPVEAEDLNFSVKSLQRSFSAASIDSGASIHVPRVTTLQAPRASSSVQLRRGHKDPRANFLAGIQANFVGNNCPNCRNSGGGVIPRVEDFKEYHTVKNELRVVSTALRTSERRRISMAAKTAESQAVAEGMRGYVVALHRAVMAFSGDARKLAASQGVQSLSTAVPGCVDAKGVTQPEALVEASGKALSDALYLIFQISQMWEEKAETAILARQAETAQLVQRIEEQTKRLLDYQSKLLGLARVRAASVRADKELVIMKQKEESARRAFSHQKEVLSELKIAQEKSKLEYKDLQSRYRSMETKLREAEDYIEMLSEKLREQEGMELQRRSEYARFLDETEHAYQAHVLQQLQDPNSSATLPPLSTPPPSLCASTSTVSIRPKTTGGTTRPRSVASVRPRTSASSPGFASSNEDDGRLRTPANKRPSTSSPGPRPNNSKPMKKSQSLNNSGVRRETIARTTNLSITSKSETAVQVRSKVRFRG